MTKCVGVLTSGGDTPGLNAAIRALGKALQGCYSTQMIGFYDGFRGLAQDRSVRLDEGALSGILTVGGTILGTSRDKPHKMPIGNQVLDMTEACVQTYERHHLDALVCLGGGGTHKNAMRLKEAGLNILTLPKTIDNDVVGTDVTIGFDTALGIATEAIDRLHSTATSHHRIMVVEIMGHRVGWLALGAGIAGGADVILIPEIPYEVESVAAAIRKRGRAGKRFSIIAVAEGALTKANVEELHKALAQKKSADNKDEKKKAAAVIDQLVTAHSHNTLRLAEQLAELTGVEARTTILGHVQRGGAPSAADRLLATKLGTRCASLIHEGRYGVMVGTTKQETVVVPLEEVAGNRKYVPLDHPWIDSARRAGAALGD
ncbi:MAG: ATP-dependent 6-phosphofructokinase [Sedimentisphaerales bacterium]|nr:ATP-dependent 6-phosphofructokinase [Sedimentisphaerales bacterium]